MPTFLLIRHGENDYVKKGKLAGRLPEVHLNKKGRDQAAAIAEHLKAAPIKAIYSSPLERAVETAQPLAQALNLEMQIRPGLLETGYGDWTDQSLKKLSRLKEWKIVQAAPSLFRFPNGESFAEAQRRICQELESIACNHEDKDLIACFSHADPIKLAITFYIGLPLDSFQRLGLSPGSISVLHIGKSSSHLAMLNYSPDLKFG